MNRLFLLALIAPTIALARPGPQWADEPQEIRQWFQSVMEPDNPTQSCCGEADAYEVEMVGNDPDGSIEVRTLAGPYEYFVGKLYSVPREKMQTRYGNPLDKSILFLSNIGKPLCLIPKSGV